MNTAQGEGGKRGGRRLGKGLGALLAADPVRVTVPPAMRDQSQDREVTGALPTGEAQTRKNLDGEIGNEQTPRGPHSPDVANPRENTAPEATGSNITLDARSGARAGTPSNGFTAGDEGIDRTNDASGGAVLRMLAVDAIVPNRYQPRSMVEESGLETLAASIARDGVLQPIVVRPAGAGRFELVAGERRWRASALAGLPAVPALVRELSDAQSAELALVENLQREDLNVVDRARALSALATGFGLTQAEVAERVGLDRSSVTNLLRLLELEAPTLDLLASGSLSGGHGKALLGAPTGPARAALAARAVSEGWSVRETERRARDAAENDGHGVNNRGSDRVTRSGAVSPRSAAVEDLEKRLGEYLGTRVAVKTNSGGTRGRVVLEFFDLDQFDGLMRRIGFERDGRA